MKHNLLKMSLRCWLLFASAILITLPTDALAQIQKPFTQRTLPATPNRKIYNVRGNYNMIGNTVLTVDGTLDNNSSNSNTNMRLVDMDNDNTTANSSMSTLTFSNENGALPECTNVVFAGLYWMGRTHDGTNVNVPLTNTVNYNSFTTQNYNLTDGNTFNAQSFGISSLSFNVSTTVTINGVSYHRVRFQFGSSSTMQYEFLSNTSGNPQFIVRKRQSSSGNNGNNWTTLSGITFSHIGDVVVAKFTNESFDISGNTYFIDSLVRDVKSSGNYPVDYRNGSGSITQSRAYLTGNITTTANKTLHKQYIRFKGPGATKYDSIQANPNNIYFSDNTNTSGGMYTAYADVTNYVKTHGVGQYWAADIATNTGNGGSTGYFGGWALVVVYENTKMEWRDITIFDGFGYMAGNVSASHILPIKGFKARQNGPVKVKMGLLAGEGDVSITGDYFRMYNQTTSTYQNLSHSGNSTNNFFNSSVNVGTGVTRLPNFQNNTGIDVSMFELNNGNFDFIKNNDDSTSFQFGSTQDTYIIPLVVFGVDAYIPDIAPINQVSSVNSTPVNQSSVIYPGDTVTYKLVVKNNGSETIKDAELKIAMPFAADFYDMSVNYYLTTGNKPTPVYNPTEGVNGTIYWGLIDSIPKPLANQNDTFAVLTYSMIATKDCYQLMNTLCQPKMTVDGFAKGVGAVSLIPIDSLPFVFGYQQTGNCLGDPITNPQVMTIDGTQYVLNNCGENDQIIKFVQCSDNATGVYPLNANVTQWFPNGSRFYNEYPLTPAAIEYTAATGIPYTSNGQTVNYYAIPPETSDECVFRFSLTVNRTPDLQSYTYNCVTAEVQVNSTIANTTYRVDTVYASPTYWATIPKPAPNTTGYFNGLKGADSMVVSLINGVCEMPFSLTFEECENPLPVEFVSFTAEKNQEHVDINWTVAKEENVAEYIIQRSTDGRKFEAIQYVKPSTSTAHIKNYVGIDKTPVNGDNYYRIKQVDHDGKYMYSVVRTVAFDGTGVNHLELFPNPTVSDINLTMQAGAAGVVEYWIINNVSQTVIPTQSINVEQGKNTIQLKVSTLADGVYFVAIKTNNGNDIQYLKFVKRSGK